jgi:tRNA dimethylallyltransferase
VVQRSLDELYVRIDERVDRMYSSGLVAEVERLLAVGVPAEAHALKAIGYRQVVNHLHGRCTISDAISETKRSSRRFAKRQLAWLNGLGVRCQRVPPVENDGAARLIDLWRRHGGEGRE